MVTNLAKHQLYMTVDSKKKKAPWKKKKKNIKRKQIKSERFMKKKRNPK